MASHIASPAHLQRPRLLNHLPRHPKPPPPPSPLRRQAYAHPVAAFFLMFFKAAAVFIYIFCGWFGTDFVINFCVITFLLVCDFWTVRRQPCVWV